MEGLTPESIFGGVVLIALFTLLLSGKLRLEREVTYRDKVIEVKDRTIEEQRQTIVTLTTQAEVTNHFLRDIREAAFGVPRTHNRTGGGTKTDGEEDA